ncbi:hypothetical protein SAMN04488503_0879 [Humidesulfovibrio mexicanus]|uniref:Uncharacterized protein n=1 Tax=Humidesulfovibrio mexicanus TaxID=147047 RepID=A0A238YDY6_9BACT|nr:hypothetical protein [Humidesulfovibrio mexicanus]SNR68961.1 hypothetical protein SAMN04488503_0879 [Humidesulfovibrio mexicanus]
MSRKPVPAGLWAALILAGLLSGCLPKTKDWVHPQMADPRKEDRLFEEDTAFCEGKIGAQVQGADRDKAMADCLGRLGWRPRE